MAEFFSTPHSPKGDAGPWAWAGVAELVRRRASAPGRALPTRTAPKNLQDIAAHTHRAQNASGLWRHRQAADFALRLAQIYRATAPATRVLASSVRVASAAILSLGVRRRWMGVAAVAVQPEAHRRVSPRCSSSATGSERARDLDPEQLARPQAGRITRSLLRVSERRLLHLSTKGH